MQLRSILSASRDPEQLAKERRAASGQRSRDTEQAVASNTQGSTGER